MVFAPPRGWGEPSFGDSPPPPPGWGGRHPWDGGWTWGGYLSGALPTPSLTANSSGINVSMCGKNVYKRVGDAWLLHVMIDMRTQWHPALPLPCASRCTLTSPRPQWKCCGTLPHCVGAVCKGTLAVPCRTAWVSGQWKFCGALPRCLGAAGSEPFAVHCRAHVPRTAAHSKCLIPADIVAISGFLGLFVVGGGYEKQWALRSEHGGCENHTNVVVSVGEGQTGCHVIATMGVSCAYESCGDSGKTPGRLCSPSAMICTPATNTKQLINSYCLKLPKGP